MLDDRVWEHSVIVRPSIFRDNSALSNLSKASKMVPLSPSSGPAERERRFAWKATGGHAPIFEVHAAVLHDAGFREVGVIWQAMGNQVLMAVR